MKQIGYVEDLFTARAAGHDAAVASDLPSGTVTFLFTDIEGSTRLLNALGAVDYAQALADHRRLLRDAFTGHGGVEVDTQGDAFFVAFRTAPDALSAGSEAQQALTDLPINVRMGLHTGTPLLTEEGYVGADVHRAARVAAAGHGGQVLLTSATAALLTDARLVDLGLHRLKDLAAAEHIYQLGDALFPPLKTLYQTNLPVPPTPFLGRADDIAKVVGLATRPDIRLLTLTGPGGTGKTRLAQQSAAELGDRYEGGVWWIPLASLRDPRLVLETAGRIVGSKNGLAEHIGDSTMLLLFDNFEQVIDAGADVALVLGACPNLRVLVTSREPLHVAGEHTLPVPPLTPTDGEDLFLARALAVLPGFVDDGAVAAICRRLDDLPLAIELAAARVTVLSSAQILARLDKRLPLLTGGARDLPERQRTLRAAIEWSYELLSEAERLLFTRLSVFRGGCTLEAAEDVAEANLDTVQSLVDKSLLRRTSERFAMLETVREFAAERLEESAAAADLRRRHAEFFLRLAEEAELPLRATGSAEWLDRLDVEHDNLRAAMDEFEATSEHQLALRVAGAISPFWWIKGHLAEGQRRLETGLLADESSTPARAKALDGAAVMALQRGDIPRSRLWTQEALRLNRQLGDAFGTAHAIYLLGHLAADGRDWPEAQRLYEQSRRAFAELGHDRYVFAATDALALASYKLGDRERARALADDNLRRARAVGEQEMEAVALGALGFYAVDEGRVEEALPLLAESTRIWRARGPGDLDEVGLNLCSFARAAALGGEMERAVQLISAAASLSEEIGAAVPAYTADLNEGTLALLREQLDETTFAALWEKGRTLTFDQAIELALDSRN